MLKATQLRPGMIIVHDGDLYAVHSVDHRTPGNKRGAMATRMRNLRSGSTIDYRFRAEDFVERAVLDEVEFQYLYSRAEGYRQRGHETRKARDRLNHPGAAIHFQWRQGKGQHHRRHVHPARTVAY